MFHIFRGLHNIFILLGMLSGSALFFSSAAAQSNLENYRPPPMFENPLSGERTLEDIRKDFEKPQISEVTPEKKKEHKFPPVPAPRPKSFTASADFIRQVQENSGTRQEQNDISETFPGPAQESHSAPMDMDITEDPVGRNITDMDARDILKNIDPDEELPPLPRKEKYRSALEISSSGALLTLTYAYGDTVLGRDKRDLILDHVLPVLKTGTGRLVLESYAGAKREGDDGGQSPRRVSLARALDVKDFLVSRGAAADRISIRALGDQAQNQPADRVDFIPE